MGILTPMRQSKQRQRPQKSGLTPKKAVSSPEGLFSPFSILFILILWSCAGHTASPKGEQHARRRATSGASGRALSAAKGERGGRQYRKEFQIDFRVPKGKPMGIGNTIRRSFPELYKRLKEWVVLPQIGCAGRQPININCLGELS